MKPNYIFLVTWLTLTFLKFGHGRRKLILNSDDDEPSVYDATTATVGNLIAVLEQRSPSLSKGVMVVAADWSKAADDGVPRGFLRTLQDRHKQPVFTADIGGLLAENRRETTGPRRREDLAESALPAPCRRPANRDVLTHLLPPRSRYVVLFRGLGTPGPFDQLARLNYTFWHVDIFYVIVVHRFTPDVRRMVYGIWRNLYIHKVIVVTPTVIKIFEPFVHNTVAGNDGTFSNVPLWSLERIPRMLSSRMENLQTFPLRFVINNRTPTVVSVLNDGGGGGGGGGAAYIGQDGTFAAVLADKMNATPVYVAESSDSGKITYGYKRTRNGTYGGTFAGVIDGRADVSVNGHFLKDYNCYSAELTRHITSDKVCLLSPKAGVIPPMLTVLMSFQREVWMMTAITCTMVTLIYFGATALDAQRPGPTGCNLGLEIYRVFIGAPTNRVFARYCQKILTSFSLIFTLVILNAFQGSLVTFLSTPMHYPDINTFKDLEQSDLPIRTSSISFKEILVGDPNLKSLAYRLEKWAKEEDIHSSDGRFAGFQRVNVFNLEHFKDVLYVSQKNDTRVLHTMNECLISYFISYVVNRNSPYKRRINTLLSWIDQAGLVLKWNGDVSKYIFNKYKPINPKDYETSKVFSVIDLEIAFIVLSFGILLSVIVFVVELSIRPKLRTRRTRRHSQLLPFLR